MSKSKRKHRWLVRVYVEGVLAHEHETLSYFTNNGIRKFYDPSKIGWIKGSCVIHFVTLDWQTQPVTKISVY